MATVQLNLRWEMHPTGEDDKTGQTNTAIIEFTGMNINHVEDLGPRYLTDHYCSSSVAIIWGPRPAEANDHQLTERTSGRTLLT